VLQSFHRPEPGNINTTTMNQSRATRSTAGKGRALRAQVRTSRFAGSLLSEWQRLNLSESNAVVVVAVSGGADSVALLLGLDELVKSGQLKLDPIVAHLNHRLRGKVSGADARWVKSLGQQLGYEVAIGNVHVKTRAAKTGDNLEQAARRARYEFLAKQARTAHSRLVLTAHTIDDQAETILLNLLRGSGATGLGGVEPVRPLSAGSETQLVRPLLSWARRRDTENFCRARSVDFLEDEMNMDEKFARVRVRRQLLPLLQTFNPKVTEGLARTAELLRDDSLALDQGAQRLLELSIESGSGPEDKRPSLRWDLLSTAPRALRRRALRLCPREASGWRPWRTRDRAAGWGASGPEARTDRVSRGLP
jgi:tRNA(Ile)-lysidine synthase